MNMNTNVNVSEKAFVELTSYEIPTSRIYSIIFLPSDLSPPSEERLGVGWLRCKS